MLIFQDFDHGCCLLTFANDVTPAVEKFQAEDGELKIEDRGWRIEDGMIGRESMIEYGGWRNARETDYSFAERQKSSARWIIRLSIAPTFCHVSSSERC